jgi:hypothetical protein
MAATESGSTSALRVQTGRSIHYRASFGGRREGRRGRKDLPRDLFPGALESALEPQHKPVQGIHREHDADQAGKPSRDLLHLGVLRVELGQEADEIARLFVAVLDQTLAERIREGCDARIGIGRAAGSGDLEPYFGLFDVGLGLLVGSVEAALR